MKAECWVTISPSFSSYPNSRTGKREVTKLTVSKVFAKKPPPSSIPNRGIAIKLELDIDEEAFQPIEPQVKVHVPVDIQEVVEVEAKPVVINRNAKVLQRKKP